MKGERTDLATAEGRTRWSAAQSLAKQGNQFRRGTGRVSSPYSSADSRYRKDWHYRTNYGITVEQYETMLVKQKGVCAICDKPPKQRRLAVDHDHKTGKVRGLLCSHCNAAVEKASGIFSYLAKHGGQSVCEV